MDRAGLAQGSILRRRRSSRRKACLRGRMTRRKRNIALRAAGAASTREARSPARPGERARHLWAKAQVASQSAKLLIESGDADGAVNRAYYALFGPARAAVATGRSSLALSKRPGTIYTPF